MHAIGCLNFWFLWHLLVRLCLDQLTLERNCLPGLAYLPCCRHCDTADEPFFLPTLVELMWHVIISLVLSFTGYLWGMGRFVSRCVGLSHFASSIKLLRHARIPLHAAAAA